MGGHKFALLANGIMTKFVIRSVDSESWLRWCDKRTDEKRVKEKVESFSRT